MITKQNKQINSIQLIKNFELELSLFKNKIALELDGDDIENPENFKILKAGINIFLQRESNRIKIETAYPRPTIRYKTDYPKIFNSIRNKFFNKKDRLSLIEALLKIKFLVAKNKLKKYSIDEMLSELESVEILIQSEVKSNSINTKFIKTTIYPSNHFILDFNNARLYCGVVNSINFDVVDTRFYFIYLNKILSEKIIEQIIGLRTDLDLEEAVLLTPFINSLRYANKIL